MEKKIKKIKRNEDLSCEFFTKLEHEMATDTEPCEKKFARISNAYLEDPDGINDLFISLCGWSFETLVEMTLKK